MNFNTYQSFLATYGNNGIERRVNKLHYDITTLLPDNPSYKTVLLNGEERKLSINSTLDTNIKNVTAMPHESLGVGNHVIYCEQDYYVTDCSVDDGIYAYGKMERCNDVIHFISPLDQSIQEVPVLVTNTTKFNTGETPNKRLTLPSGQYSMLVPVNEHTILIDNEMRFLIDKRKDFPTAYRVTYVDTSTYGYDDCLLNIVLLQCELNIHRDNIELMIADYFPQEEVIEEQSITLDTTSPFVKIGGSSKIFAPVMTDGIETPLRFSISADSSILPYVSYDTTDTTISIKVANNQKLIGNFITLTITDANGENEFITLIQIKGLI